MMDMNRFLYNSYQNRWNLACAGHGQIPSQFLIKIIEIRLVMDISRFLYNSLSKSLKSGLCWTWADSLTFPNQHRWNAACDGHRQILLQSLIKIIEISLLMDINRFPYDSLSKSLKSSLWWTWADSFFFPPYYIPYLAGAWAGAWAGGSARYPRYPQRLAFREY